MIKVLGKIRALLWRIRYFFRLPSVALKVIFTEGPAGFWRKFTNWLHKLTSGRLKHEIAAESNASSRAYGNAYFAEKVDYYSEIVRMLEDSHQLSDLDGKDSIDVVVPIYNAYDDFLKCLYSLIKHQDIYRISLLDDCSTDTRMKDFLRVLKDHEQERLRVETNPQNLGFLKTVNKGMRMAKNDVILLNTDTIVTSGWGQKMRACAYSDNRIATVTPFTNNGRMCSVPEFLENNEIPEGFTIDSFAECVENASSNRYPELVTGVGFCMYIRKSVLDEIGYFDDVNFGKGYGEEVDFSFKATYKGYKNVLCDNTFIFHKGKASFLEIQSALMEKNHIFLSEKYPELWAAIARFEQSNPLKGLHDEIKTEMKAWNVRRLGSEVSRPFSLTGLLRENPGLAYHYLWDSNPMPKESDSMWLHLGCGVRVLDGFVNIDIAPQDVRVIRWNLLDLWPDELNDKVEGVFSEDCIEHFFHAEQIYILCNINRALKSASVARILMPSLARLIDDYSANYLAAPEGFLHSTYGVETSGDALNYGMRFTGHRWLHDPQSLKLMSDLCGFESTATDCASSSVAKFNNLNLRDESNSASFANDLRKRRSISRILVSPTLVKGARKVEDLAADSKLFVATSQRPVVEYHLPKSVASESVACINFRSSNLSSFDWGLKTLVIEEINRAKPWYFDETLKSQPCMNLITKSQLQLVLGGNQDFSRLSFSPATNSGEYFTLGCVEVFVLE